MKNRIIIGIHGLGNKPPHPLLERWWQKAICEGLERSGYSQKHFKFDLVYWAHFLYSEPLNVNVSSSDHPLYIEHPYVPATKAHNQPSSNRIKKKMLDWIEFLMEKAFFPGNRFFNFDRVGDYIIRKKFRDLELYYHKDNVELDQAGLLAKKMLREALAKKLQKHRKKEILLISHSMGTVIAYDVLTQLVPHIKVHTFITMGSPLGLPTIIKEIFAEQNKEMNDSKLASTPENIQHQWINFSDLNDRIALNYSLCDDFSKNSLGIGPADVVVQNDYEYLQKKNHHKSYGYLRASEVASVIHEFISGEKAGLVEKLRRLFRNII